MAWCGTDFTIVRVGAAADANGPDASPSNNTTLMCFGKKNPGYCTELPDAEKEQEYLRTPHAIPRPGLNWRRDAVQVAFGKQHGGHGKPADDEPDAREQRRREARHGELAAEVRRSPQDVERGERADHCRA